jgi:hypothetical protein
MLRPFIHRIFSQGAGSFMGSRRGPPDLVLPVLEAMILRGDETILAHAGDAQPILGQLVTVGAAGLARQALQCFGYSREGLDVHVAGLADRFRDARKFSVAIILSSMWFVDGIGHPGAGCHPHRSSRVTSL